MTHDSGLDQSFISGENVSLVFVCVEAGEIKSDHILHASLYYSIHATALL